MTVGDPPYLNYPLRGPAAHIDNVEQPEKITHLILDHLEAT